MSTYRKMTEENVRSILGFLTSYDSPAKTIRWQDIEEYSKFTRQALQAHPRIKETYQATKSRLSNEKAALKSAKPQLDSVASAKLVEKLYARIAVLENQHELWRRRWYCIAYNIRNQGVQMFDIDKPVPIGAKPLSGKEIRSELGNLRTSLQLCENPRNT